jgi:hypothetical protein
MAITFPASSHAVSATVTAPAGIADGDVLIAAALGVSASAIATPAGWTQVAQPNLSTSRLGVFSRVVTDAAGEPESYTFTGWAAVGITRCVGVDPDAVLDSLVTTNSATNDAVIPGVTTATDGAAVMVGGYVSNPTIQISGITQLWNESGILGLSGEAQATAGSSGTRTVGSSGAETTAIGVMFALKPLPEPEPTIRVTGTLTIDLSIGIG